jgi:SAM-dependent methyltransferase
MAAGLRERLQPVRAGARRRARMARRWALRARLDFQDWRSGDRDPLLPPRRLGLPSQIAAVGDRLVGIVVDKGKLKPDGAILDMGCGPGRTAAPLTKYLTASARYEGFDVMPKSIAWCRKAIMPRFPNFHFQVADIHNAQYNPAGTQRASDYRFPYEDASFDAAVAGSLFTHLRPFEGQRYLDEAARTLRPGGRLVATWFLIDEEVDAALAAGKVKKQGIFNEGRPPLRLEHHLTDEQGNPFRSFDPETPEYMIALDESFVRAQYDRAGLEIVEILYGHWPGREASPEGLGQDAIIAERRA